MDRIILIGVDQGVMIGGRFDGWLAQLTYAGWVTIRKLDEADPYAALPDVLRQSQSMNLGAVGPATGTGKRPRGLLSQFPVVDAQGLHEDMLIEALAKPPEPACGDAVREAAESARSQAEMLLLAIMEGDPAGELKVRVNDIIDTLAALSAPASPPAGVQTDPPVEVKALAWVKDDSEPNWWSAPAFTMAAGYETWASSTGAVRLRKVGESKFSLFDGTIDEAKAVCQADYEARIRSALARPASAPTCNDSLQVERAATENEEQG